MKSRWDVLGLDCVIAIVVEELRQVLQAGSALLVGRLSWANFPINGIKVRNFPEGAIDENARVVEIRVLSWPEDVFISAVFQKMDMRNNDPDGSTIPPFWELNYGSITIPELNARFSLTASGEKKNYYERRPLRLRQEPRDW